MPGHHSERLFAGGWQRGHDSQGVGHRHVHGQGPVRPHGTHSLRGTGSPQKVCRLVQLRRNSPNLGDILKDAGRQLARIVFSLFVIHISFFF